MKTELEQQTQTQDALTNVQGAQPVELLHQNLVSTVPPMYLNDKVWQDANRVDEFRPPSTKEINKQMWVGSFMTALMVGLTTGDAGAAITGGLMGGIAIHDYGHALRKRAQHLPQMKKDGFSAQAMLAYYEDGNQELINQERDDMLAGKRFNQSVRQSDRNFTEGQRRFDENMGYREASMAQRERFQQANLSFRRQTLDMRREQLSAQLAKGQLAERVNGMAPLELAQTILTTGIDPVTGMKATGERTKQARTWAEGRQAYHSQRSGIINQLDKVAELMNLDVANGTGLEGYVTPSLFMSGEAQQVRSLLDNLKSGQFITNVQALKGMGALSEQEGARIQGVVASLDPTMSEDELRRQLGDVQRVLITALEQADENALFQQWGVPENKQQPQQPQEQPEKASEPVKGSGTRTGSNGVTYSYEGGQ